MNVQVGTIKQTSLWPPLIPPSQDIHPFWEMAEETFPKSKMADEQSTTICLTVKIHANNRPNNFKQHVQHQLKCCREAWWQSRGRCRRVTVAIIKCSSLTFAACCCGCNLAMTIKLQHMWMHVCRDGWQKGAVGWAGQPGGRQADRHWRRLAAKMLPVVLWKWN